MGKICRCAEAPIYEPPFMHHAPALLAQLVDEAAIVGTGIRALLRRADDISIGLSREEIEAVRQGVETATTEGLEIVGRQIAVARQRFEDTFYVALGEYREFWL